jgi:UDP-glucose 4-epimerase
VSTVYDVAVVGSGGFLGSAITAQIESRGAHVGRFTKESPYQGGASTVVWAAGHVTPADTSNAGQALADLRGLIDGAAAASEQPHVVLLSSGGAVYGPPATAPFSETDEPSPANEYGRVKLAEEALLAESDLPHTVLRVANPYGPAQVTGAARARGGQGVIGQWLAAVSSGIPITMFGDGSAVRDFIFVDDLAQAVALVAARKPRGIFNIGSGEGTSLAKLLNLVTDVVAPHPVEVRREPARGIDPPAAWLDVSHARSELGWGATTRLADGVAQTWAAVQG